MNKCKDCRWFGPCSGDFGNDSKEKGPYYNFGRCKNKIFAEETYNETKDALMIYWDSEGLNAHFRVHENFSCIGFEKQ